MKNRIKSLSYRKKIFLGMLFSAVIPMAIYYLITMQVVKMYYSNSLMKSAGETLAVLDSTMEDSLNEIVNCIKEMTNNSEVKKTLFADKVEETPALYKQLYLMTRNYGNVADFCVYDAEGNLVSATSDSPYCAEKLAVDWGVLYEATNAPEDVIIRNARYYYGTKKDEFLRISKAVTDNAGNVIGYAVSVISDDGFDFLLDNLELESGGVIHITDEFDELIYYSSTVSDEKGYLAAEKRLLESGDYYFKTENENFRYYHFYNENLKLNYFLRQEVGTYINIHNETRTFGLLIGTVSALFCLALSAVFSNSFYQPVLNITEALEKIKGGDYSVRIKTDSMDELGVLSKNVNSMTATLEKNTREIVNHERELNEANIKMMTAQLNPHFIYNTLDTMKWMGKANDVPEIATISTGLAQILRSSISSEQLVPLEKEIDILNAYLDIQKIRFEDKFEYVIDIPDEFKKYRVPKLMLQPIVENSIVHGFEGLDHGRILIMAYSEGNILCIDVKDDGNGVDKSSLFDLNHNIEEVVAEDRGKIGIHNVQRIIKLHFGEQYGLYIESEKGRGTVVKYRLPMLTEEEKTND